MRELTRTFGTASRRAMVAGLAAPLAFAPVSSFAQDDTMVGGTAQQPVDREDDVEAGNLDVIVVTATKRATSLQDTTLAISAFDGGALEDRGINDITSLEAYVPTLHVGQEQDGFKISIRGIGLQGTSAISDSGVAFYQDDFYVPRPSGGAATFFDIDRVEVLRGPQGTLYGRNATGGVVNVIANEPGQEFEGRIGGSVGERNLRQLRGIVNVPLGEKVAARFSAVYNEEDGYVEALAGSGPGVKDLFGRDGDISVRSQLKFDDDDLGTLLLSVTHSNLNGTGVPLQFLERNPGGPPPTRALLGTLPPDLDSPTEIRSDIDSQNDTDTTIAFVRGTKAFDGFDVFLQGGMLWQDTDLVQDVDGTEVDVSVFFKTLDNEARSVEFRVNSNGGGRFDWLGGLYYFEEETDLVRRVELNGLTPGGVIALPNFLLTERGESETAAAFGSVTFAVTDQVSLTGGLRYTYDERRGEKFTFSNFGRPPPPDLEDLQVDYGRVTWKAGAEWRPTGNFLGYVSASNGYKAGGFNLTSSGQPYDPEEVIAFEGGFKSNPFSRRVQLNADAFYYDYSDLQLTNLTSVNDAPGQLTTNAAQTTIWGAEINGHVDITDDFRLTGGYAYTDATFDEFFNTDPRGTAPPNPDDPLGLGRTDLSGNELPFVSQNSANFGGSYAFDLGPDNDLVFAANTYWHDGLFLREYNDPVIDRVGSNTRTDANITWFNEPTGLELTAFVTNIENEVEKNNIQVSPGFIGQSALAIYTKPRTWGLRADYRF